MGEQLLPDLKPGDPGNLLAGDLLAGKEQRLSLVGEALSWGQKNLLNPAVNAGLLEPYNAIAHTADALSRATLGSDLLAEKKLLDVPAADSTASWLAQNIAGGLGMVAPYTLAGKAFGSAMRTGGAALKVEGTAAMLLRSQELAMIGGAATYDGLRVTRAGETHLGNALGGAAGFFVFGRGNELSRRLGGVSGLGLRVLTGAAGADTQHTVSKLVSAGELPGKAELLQASLSGAVMNVALPVAQDALTRAVVDVRLNTGGSAPVDQYLKAHFTQEALSKSTSLSTLVNENPWSRVAYSPSYNDFKTKENRIELKQSRSTPENVGRELAHLSLSRSKEMEAGFQAAAAQLKAGNREQAWQLFHDTRLAQETEAHNQSHLIAGELKGSPLLAPAHLKLEMGAWPAPGGVSYELRWRQEFSQFETANGQYRPGTPLSTSSPFIGDQAAHPTQPGKLSEAEAISTRQRETATSLVRDLQKEGFIAVFAGGSVRDAEMGRTPKDYDIATSAKPGEVEQLFASRGYKVIPTGKAFGVINVIAGGETFEIATLRNDGQYSDGRRPDSVQYVSSLYEDAARRDLTINALFKDPTTNTTYDFFGGKKDIADRTIRTVGDPQRRFSEDNLRMMRVPRFASRFEGFTVDPAVVDAIKMQAPEISKVSGERLREEMRGILTSQQPGLGLDLMMETGLMKQILPEVAETATPKGMQDPVWHPEGLTWTHTKMVVDGLKGSRFEVMLGGLLHDIGKPATQKIYADGSISNHGHAEVGAEMARNIANRLRLSNNQKTDVFNLVNLHMRMHHVQEMRQSKLMELLERPDIHDLIALQHADATGTLRSDRAAYSNRDFLLGKLEESKSAEPSQQLNARALVDGKMLLSLGLKPGQRIGEIKDAAREAQREGAFANLEEARQWLFERYPELKPKH